MRKSLCACLITCSCMFGYATPSMADLAVALANVNASPGDVSPGCIAPSLPSDNPTPVELLRHQQLLIEEHQGKTIKAIHYRNANVFDETNSEEDNRLYRFLNKVHIHTLEEVIASQLLFREGDSLNASTVAESERLLRSRNYLARAYITLNELCDHSVEVTVYTQDSWTTEPQVSFGHSGGETSSGFALAEGNFLGTGNSIAIGYRKDADRSGINYYFSSPHFLNSRLAATFGYSDNSDGEDSVVDVSYPFYSLKTPLSFGLKSEVVTQLEPIRSKGEVIDEYRHNIERHQMYFGRALSINDDRTHRLLFGVSKEIDSYDTTEKTAGGLPREINILYPWLEYQYLENAYSVYRNIDQIQRTEDIALGKTLMFRLGFGGEYWNGQDDVTRYKGNYTEAMAVADRHLTRWSFHIDGTRFSRQENMDSLIAGGQISYYFLEDNNNRWYTRLRFDAGKHLLPHQMLSVGGTVGVRGYPLEFQRGDRRYIFSLERRYFSDLHLFNLFRLGYVAFFDAGRAWGNREHSYSTQHLSNVGLGLRLSSSKARIGHIVHFDVAFPVADKQDAHHIQWLIKAEQTF